jgi:hypothetical protein
MISAMIKGKTEVKEDKITSSVFDSLLHLPDEMLWRIIKNSCYDNSNLPTNAGALLDHEFWPHWDKKNTENERYVEPDLFLCFENIDIIIEAKREDTKQGKRQWKNELIAYKNKPYHDKEAVLLAIDGIESENREKINIKKDEIIYVYKTRWTKIYSTIKKCLDEMDKTKNDNIIRILSFLEKIMIYYNFMEKTWFNELLEKKITFINIMNSITILRSNIFTFQYENNWFIDMLKKNITINSKSIVYIKSWGRDNGKV